MDVRQGSVGVLGELPLVEVEERLGVLVLRLAVV